MRDHQSGILPPPLRPPRPPSKRKYLLGLHRRGKDMRKYVLRRESPKCFAKSGSHSAALQRLLIFECLRRKILSFSVGTKNTSRHAHTVRAIFSPLPQVFCLLA